MSILPISKEYKTNNKWFYYYYYNIHTIFISYSYPALFNLLPNAYPKYIIKEPVPNLATDYCLNASLVAHNSFCLGDSPILKGTNGPRSQRDCLKILVIVLIKENLLVK